MKGLLKIPYAATIASLLLFSLMSANINILGIKTALAATTDNAITLRAVDLGGNEIPGLFVAIQDTAFNTIASGFSPFTANGLTAGTYYVAVYNNYADPVGLTYTFLSASSPNHPELIPGAFTITSYGGFGSVSIPDDGTSYAITVNGSYSKYTTGSPDNTSPIVTLTPSRAPDQGTFYRTPVQFAISGDDGTTGNNGIAFCDSSPITYSSLDGTSITLGGHCTDYAGNQGLGTATFNYDATPPTNIAFTSGITNGATYPYGSVPAAPTCTTTDATSGLASCIVSGYSTATGPHTLIASATDNAGNSASSQISYTVTSPDVWRISGFYQPVDMNNVVNTLKSGQSVPLKFEVFVNNIERADATIGGTTIRSFTQQQISCGTVASDALDAVELTNTGGTSLRYDSTSGQYIANWKTPSNSANTCWKISIITEDSASTNIAALFKLTK
jgi:hypothetical protein